MDCIPIVKCGIHNNFQILFTGNYDLVSFPNMYIFYSPYFFLIVEYLFHNLTNQHMDPRFPRDGKVRKQSKLFDSAQC